MYNPRYVDVAKLDCTPGALTPIRGAAEILLNEMIIMSGAFITEVGRSSDVCTYCESILEDRSSCKQCGAPRE